MKNNFLLLILLMLVNLTAQGQNSSWILGSKYSIMNLTPQSLPTPGPIDTNPYNGYDGQVAKNAQNIITDANNQIRFFIVDGFIYDRNGNFITEMTATISGFPVTGYKGQTAVVPIPGSCDEYLIVSTSKFDEHSQELGSRTFYGRLKVQYSNNGQLNPCSGLIPFVDPLNGDESDMIDLADLAGDEYFAGGFIGYSHYEYHKFAVTKSLNGKQYLFVSNHQKVYKFLINSTGLTYSGFIDLVNVDPTLTGILGYERSEMEVMSYNGNFRLAIPVNSVPGAGVFNGVLVMDVDPASGTFVGGSNKLIKYSYVSSIVPQVEIKGVEFSQNGERLYLTHNSISTYNSTIDRFDLTNVDPTSTIQIVSTDPIYKDSHIERIANDRIIIPTQSSMRVLNNTNSTSIPSINTLFGLTSYNAVSPFASNSASDDFARLLQCQIDDFDYVGYLSEGIQCCLDNREYDKNNFTAPSNAIWSAGGNPLNGNTGADVYIKTELRIPAEVTITIQGMNLYFAPGARLVIENSPTSGGQGGKLILDGTTLTVDDRCSDDAMWLGVEVWGNQSVSQGTFASSSQGRLELRNNSIIEHARIGALASKRNSASVEICPGVFESNVLAESFDNTRNGGIIIARNSFFLNNQTGVFIPKYYSQANANHLARFTNTVFEWTGLLKDLSLTIQYHARLIENNGVSFYGCDFINSAPGVFDDLNGQGTGIHGLTATFYVNSLCNSIPPIGTPCPSHDRSTFQNLTTGIVAFYFLTHKAFNCQNSTFTDCRYGIHTRNSDLIKVTQNIFEVRENDTYQTAGLTMYHSTGYTVEANNFYEFDNSLITDGTGNSYGIVVNNSGALHNEIYRNRFWNLKIGGQSEKQNAVQSASQIPNSPELFLMTGLVWKCNNFDNIYETDLNLLGSIDWFQGNSFFDVNTTQLEAKRKAANNRFSLAYEDPNGASFIPAHDLKASDDSQQYKYTWIVGGHMYPDNISTNNLIQRDEIDFFPTITDTTGACPSKLISKQKEPIRIERAVMKDQIVQLRAYIDKGDKEGLLSYIATWKDKNAVKNELMSASPYLSDEVLMAYINSSPPSAMLKDVMIANSPLSTEVKDVLATVNLPIGTKNQINAAQTGTSQRLLLYSEINYLDGVFSELYYDLLRMDLFDTVNVNAMDSLIVTLEEEGTLDSKEMLLETYILKGDNARADAVRSELIAQNVPAELIELTDVIKTIRPLQATSWAFDNNPVMKAQVENIRDNSVYPSIAEKARLMLETDENVSDFLTAYSNRNMQQDSDENALIEVNIPLYVSIYPNPSTGIVYFDYPELGEGILSLQLLDLNGKEMYSHNSASESNGERVDLSHIKKGMYLVRVSIDGEYIETQKLFLK